MFRFSNPEYLYLLLLIPVIIGLFWYSVRKQKQWINSFGIYKTILKLMPGHSFNGIPFVSKSSGLLVLAYTKLS